MTFHSQIDGQSKRTIRTQEDLLKACVLDFWGSWIAHLFLIEFAYNNSYHSNIGMAPYEALYGRRCRSLVAWEEPDKDVNLSPKLIQQTVDKVKLIRDRLQVTQDW